MYVIDDTVISSRKSSNALPLGALMTLPGSLATEARQGELNIDLRTSAVLGALSIRSVHDYYPFAFEDGGQLAPIAVDQVELLAYFLRFYCMSAAVSRSLRSNSYVRIKEFVDLFADLLIVFLSAGSRVMCVESACNIFPWFFTAPCDHIFRMLCMRAALMLLRAFLSPWAKPV
jgi:hypothetical protein